MASNSRCGADYCKQEMFRVRLLVAREVWEVERGAERDVDGVGR